MLHVTDRTNNLDFLRLLFSSLVILHHSFPLTYHPEILSSITNHQVDFGDLSVNIFFIISGYLIINSLLYSKTPTSYLWKRGLRLFPGLFFMLLFSLIIIAILYEGENILNEKSFFTYLPYNMSLYKVQYFVDGVFENNIYPKAINGSLWTLSYEFTMYIFILSLYPFRKDRLLLTLILAYSFIIAFFAANFKPELLNSKISSILLSSNHLYSLAAFFISGSLLAMFNLNKFNKPIINVALFVLLLTSLFLNTYELLSYLLLPPLVLFIGLSYSKVLAYIPSKIGDISYGVYIYGFLVQQTLMHFYNFNPYILAILSLGITYIISYASWHLIEKRFLEYKNII